jgi:hypothetical protein
MQEAGKVFCRATIAVFDSVILTVGPGCAKRK